MCASLCVGLLSIYKKIDTPLMCFMKPWPLEDSKLYTLRMDNQASFEAKARQAFTTKAEDTIWLEEQ